MDYKRYLFILLLILLILIPFSLSDKVTQVSANSLTSLEIAYPKINYYPINQDVEFNFHVYNSTGWLLDNTTTNCEIHLYDNLGMHIIEEHLDYHYDDFYIIFNSSVFTHVGEYAYLVSCNNSQSGFISSNFIINKLGKEEKDSFFPIILIFVIIGIVYYFIGNLNQKNIKMDATKASTWLTVASYSMIIVKVISLSYFAYGFYVNADISGLLNTSFILDLVLISILIILTLFFGVIALSSFGDDANKWNPRKW